MEYKVYGCKVNKYYLNKWLSYLESLQEYQGAQGEDVVVLATCVVTDRAKGKWINELIKEVKSGKRVLLIGCGSIERGAGITSERFFQFYPELLPYAEQITLLPEDPFSIDGTGSFGAISPEQLLWTKNYVIIQNGCDNHCSFCLTVAKRGSHRSRPLDEILDEIRYIQDQGGKEIVLTGINLAAWGAKSSLDGSSDFSYLLQQILKKTSIPRIRISSLDPQYLDDAFFEVVTDKRFLPHFHLSIQSFSDSVLQRMNRAYNRERLDQVLSRLKALKREDQDFISLGADLIVGFPGETVRDFQDTLDGVSYYQINKLHAFPFSQHQRGEKIPAYYLPDQIEFSEKKSRNQKLIALGNHIRADFLRKNIGRKATVLVESFKKGKSIAWTDNYIQVQLPEHYPAGELLELELSEAVMI